MEFTLCHHILFIIFKTPSNWNQVSVLCLCRSFWTFYRWYYQGPVDGMEPTLRLPNQAKSHNACQQMMWMGNSCRSLTHGSELQIKWKLVLTNINCALRLVMLCTLLLRGFWKGQVVSTSVGGGKEEGIATTRYAGYKGVKASTAVDVKDRANHFRAAIRYNG